MDNLKTKYAEDLASIDKMKHSVNLIQFACHKFNYIPDWQHPAIKRADIKSTPNSVKLVKADNPLDSIIVSFRHPKFNPANPENSKTPKYYYFSLKETQDHGSIVDFVKTRVDDFSFSKLRKMVKNYESAVEKGIFKDLGLNINKGANLEHFPAGNKPDIDTFKTYLQPLNDKSYLTNRGIDDASIDKYLKFGYNLKETNGSTSFVVPYYSVVTGEDQVKKLELQTYQKYSTENVIKKQFLSGGKSDSIWISSIDKTKKISALVVSESPLDSISYASLNKKECGKNPMLAASGGNIGYSQSDSIGKLMELTGAKKIILANDNDCKGNRYNAQILASLPVKGLADKEFVDANKAMVDVKMEVGVSGNKGYVEWHFSHENVVEVLPAFVGVKDYYLQENHDNKKLNDGKDVFNLVDTTFKSNSSTIKVEFQNTVDNWEKMNESIQFLKFGNTDQIKVEKSICKDWNDDLKIIKGVDYKPLKEDAELLNDFVAKGFLSEKQVETIKIKLEPAVVSEKETLKIKL